MAGDFLGGLSRGDTIVAPATIVGHSALAVLRVSGRECGRIVSEGFRRMDGGAQEGFEPRRVYLGWWKREGEALDQVTVVYYAGPASYTGEDMLEITCHGGRATVAAILGSLVAAGARLAEAGEFTLRAFIAGKVDLPEAEAIEALVGARNERARRLAVRQLSGDLSRVLEGLKSELTDAAVEIESALEFPEEQLGTGERGRLEALLAGLEERGRRLLLAGEREALYQRGHSVVLLGRPNVGKSTLLNAILGRERALVSAIAGTTRDLLEEELLMGGRVCKLIDGAGLCETADAVERLGIERIKAAAAEAWAWILVAEAGPEERVKGEVEALLAELPAAGCVKMVVLTKADLYPAVLLQRAGPGGWQAQHAAQLRAVPVCALTGEGIAELLEALGASLGEAPPPEGEDAFLLSERQRAGLETLVASLAENRRRLEEGETLDVLAEGLRESHAALGELLGEKVRADIVGEIFRRFCIGK
ncbi:tRNA uridine-5-carboxymethylaminomethyl(34) synthesis GTPase MnmE [bacterium]|nr:tRNA uridine-5-carboxymethylaminomethyl(34) synthesis GTPase MnmE [bacterium]